MSEHRTVGTTSKGLTNGAILDQWSSMSLPRPIYNNQLYLVTRRTSERRFFLTPTKKRTEQVEYCIAVAAARHGVRIHAVTVLSNHWHCVASDPNGAMPEFLRDTHSWVAKVVNAGIGRWESLWSSTQTSLVRADGDNNVLNRIVYTLANPVAAGLVAHGHSWPGLRASWPQKRQQVPRPRLFRDSGPMPEHATLELVRPPGFEDIDDKLLTELLGSAVEQREQFHRDVMQRQGRTFLGRRTIRKQSVFDTPAPGEPRRQMSPRVAEKNKWRRIEALQRLRDFLERYRRAYALFRAGFRDVVFPAGTYKLNRTAAVQCAPS